MTPPENLAPERAGCIPKEQKVLVCPGEGRALLRTQEFPVEREALTPQPGSRQQRKGYEANLLPATASPASSPALLSFTWKKANTYSLSPRREKGR